MNAAFALDYGFAKRHGVLLLPGDGARVGLRSRRGAIEVQLRRDDGTPRGTVFLPFAYVEAAANLLTHAALDPVGKIAELKYCAVDVRPLPAARATVRH